MNVPEIHAKYILSSFYRQQNHGSFGETVRSAIVAIKKARLRLENPLFPEKESTKEEQIQRV